MQLFYASGINASEHVLGQEESRHCIKVLRLGKGDRINLTDGKGNMFTAGILEDDPRRCRLEILERLTEFGKRDYTVTIAIAPIKNVARFEWFLEKATEIGIDSIVPFTSSNSERNRINKDRCEKILISAMKQSFRAYLPVLNEVISIDEILKLPFVGQKFIAHVSDKRTPHLKDVCAKGTNTLILIGPEGDFAPEEVERAIENSFVQINLGPNRLRTETAGVVACQIANLVNQ